MEAPEIYEEVSPPEGFVPFASDDEDSEEPVAEDSPSVWDEPVEEAADAADEPVAEAEAPGFSGPLGPVLDALAASEQPSEPVVEETAEEEKAPVAIEPKLPDFEPVPFETGVELEAEDVKWIVLLVLLNQPGQENAFALMEELIYNGDPGELH